MAAGPALDATEERAAREGDHGEAHAGALGLRVELWIRKVDDREIEDLRGFVDPDERVGVDHAHPWIRERVHCNMIYVGGASTNASFERLMAEGFDFIQLGRTLLSDPFLPDAFRRTDGLPAER